MDINFENPFKFHMSTVEIDDNIPSMRSVVRIIVRQFQDSFEYDGEVWIECSVWDKFLKGLRDLSSQDAILYDIDELFLFSLQRRNSKFYLAWKFKKYCTDSSEYMIAECKFCLDDDSLAKICDEFKNYPVWW